MLIISKNKKFCWFEGHEIDNFTSINADIIKVIDIVGCEGWELVGSIQAIPICCHMNLYSPTLTPNFDLPWPLRPLCDLLDIFFQLQNIQLNRFINGTPWYMAKTCATGFQNLGCYAAKTTFYFIEEPIVWHKPLEKKFQLGILNFCFIQGIVYGVKFSHWILPNKPCPVWSKSSKSLA